MPIPAAFEEKLGKQHNCLMLKFPCPTLSSYPLRGSWVTCPALLSATLCIWAYTYLPPHFHYSCFSCLPSYRSLDLLDLLLLEEYFSVLPFWDGGRNNYVIIKFKLSWGWRKGKREKGERNEEVGIKLIQSIFSE